MDAQSLIGIAQFLLVAIFLMVAVNLYLVFRLKDIDPFARWNRDVINANLFMLFLIVGLAAAFISTNTWSHKLTLMINPASEHGAEIDRMMYNTMYVSVFVTILTNILLFYYAWRYRYREGRKALFYPHNNRLEVVWTVVPAIVLTLLVFDGVGVWHDIMRDLPEEKLSKAVHVEVNGKQFAWTVRYPGADNEYGDSHVSYIDAVNDIGINFEDPKSQDDLIVQEIHVPVDRDVQLRIRSRDVLHSATLAHFRVKMDAVPGMPTSFHFKPTVTTKEMRERTNNPDFNYEMSCQQICGGGHWNMRRVVVVETEEEYQAWLKEQQKTPYFETWKSMASVEQVEAAERAARIAMEEAAKVQSEEEVAMVK